MSSGVSGVLVVSVFTVSTGVGVGTGVGIGSGTSFSDEQAAISRTVNPINRLFFIVSFFTLLVLIIRLQSYEQIRFPSVTIVQNDSNIV